MASDRTLGSLITDALSWLGRVRHAQLPRPVLAILGLGFVLLTVVAARNLPTDEMDDLRPAPIALAVALVAVTIWLSSESYRSQGLVLGVEVERSESVRTQVMAMSANLLPIPGAALVRTAALVNAGTTAAKATTTTSLTGLIWLAYSGLIAGPAFMANDQTLIGTLAVAIALGLLGVSAAITYRIAVGSTARAFWALSWPILGLIAIFGTRYALLIVGLGIDASVSQVLALVLVGALASAVGVFPSGIGVREVMAAAAAGLVDLPASVGYVVAAIDDAAVIVVIAVFAAVVVRAVPKGDQEITATASES